MGGAPRPSRPSKRTVQVLATVVLAVVVLLGGWLQSQGFGGPGPERRDEPSPSAGGSSSASLADRDGIPYVALDDLPPEAAETVALIDAGGPFPHPGKDGSTFGNFEGLLPDRPRGYYAEYTVETPGLSHRGARRIVVGDGGELYWTEDHYESFERIRR